MKKPFSYFKFGSIAIIFTLLLAASTVAFADSFVISVKTGKLSYHGADNVYISGKLTYNYWPIENNLVSIEVRDPDNMTILMTTQQTNADGEYSYMFKLPEPSKSGMYTVYVVAEHSGLVATNQTTFEVKSIGTIYIKADGSIEPVTAPISSADNVTYVLTGDIYDTVEVEKDYVTVDGANHILEGNGTLYSTGFHLAGFNITIRDTNIRGFWYGIEFWGSWGHVITENNIKGNMIGICSHLHGGSATISKNLIANNNTGIKIYQSNYNVITQNKIINNEYGISIEFESKYNTVTENIVAKNIVGISLHGHNVEYNSIYHNSFLWNDYQVFLYESENSWDGSYPSGGNYWSDYAGVDVYSGPYQNETGSDGIGDTAYVIGEGVADRYPLMNPYGVGHDIGIMGVTLSRTLIWEGLPVDINVTVANYGSYEETFNVTIYVNDDAVHTFTDVTLTKTSFTTLTCTLVIIGGSGGKRTIRAYAWPVPEETEVADNQASGMVLIVFPYDVNGDGKIDVKDLYLVARAYGSDPSRPNWNPNCDTNGDNKIDMKDYYAICKHYGTVYP